MGSIGLCNHVCPCHWADTFRAHFGNIELEMAILFRSSIRDFFYHFCVYLFENVSEPTKPKVDVLSILLSTIGFGGIVYGFSSSGEGWDSFQVYGIILIGLVALLFFVLRQLKLKEPLLDLSAFKYPMFTLTTILLTIMMMTMFSTMTLLPFLFQGALGLTVYATGLIMLPGSLLNGLLSPVSGSFLINLVQERSLFLVRYY